MSSESLQWPEGVCEVCGEPAEMHFTAKIFQIGGSHRAILPV